MEQYELDGDLKFVDTDGLKSQAPKHEFKSKCRPRSV